MLEVAADSQIERVSFVAGQDEAGANFYPRQHDCEAKGPYSDCLHRVAPSIDVSSTTIKSRQQRGIV